MPGPVTASGTLSRLAATHNTDGEDPYAAGQFLRIMLENSGELAADSPVTYNGEPSSCNEALPAFIERALDDDRTANVHETTGQLLENVTLAFLVDETDAWTYENTLPNVQATFDWSQHLHDLTHETITENGTVSNGDLANDVPPVVGAWGMHYFRIDEPAVNATPAFADTADARVNCSGSGDEQNWTIRLVNLTDGAIAQSSDVVSCQDRVKLNLEDDTATYIGATRLAQSADEYTVEIEPWGSNG